MPGTYARDYIPQVTLILDARGIPSFPEPHHRPWFVSDADAEPGNAFTDADDTSLLGEWLWWSTFARITKQESDAAVALSYRLAVLAGGDL